MRASVRRRDATHGLDRPEPAWCRLRVLALRPLAGVPWRRMRIPRALLFPLLVFACGAPASSAPPAESGEGEPAASEAEATTGDTTEA